MVVRHLQAISLKDAVYAMIAKIYSYREKKSTNLLSFAILESLNSNKKDVIRIETL